MYQGLGEGFMNATLSFGTANATPGCEKDDLLKINLGSFLVYESNQAVISPAIVKKLLKLFWVVPITYIGAVDVFFEHGRCSSNISVKLKRTCFKSLIIWIEEFRHGC